MLHFHIFVYYCFTGSYLLEKIQDSAGQKGTGKWTAVAALEYGMPVTLIGESVFARCLSSLLDERKQASLVLKGPPSSQYTGDKKQFLEHIRQVGQHESMRYDVFTEKISLFAL